MFLSRCLFSFAGVFLVFAFGISEIKCRKLSITYNEDCDIPECEGKNESSNTFNLAHVVAVGDNDTVHYLWSSVGGPTILLAVTDHKSQLMVNWKKLLVEEDVSKSIEFTSVPTYSMAMLVTKLIEFNDTKDTADVSNPNSNVTMITPLDSINWLNFNDTIDSKTCSGTFQSIRKYKKTNSTLSVKVRAYNETGRATALPHMQYTENTTQFDFSIKNFPSHFLNSRYAVEVLMVSDKAAELHVKKSIDDEYTPAIFSIMNFVAPASSKSLLGSYSQWKPVVYSDAKHSLSDALQCHESNVIQYSDKIPNRSIIRAFFDISHVKLSAVNISFGTTKDKFYKNTNYTSCTCTMANISRILKLNTW
ncbi:glycosylated lysosomal membrane protein A-like isoform X2 [Antedon mediterranea]|uniref:glycosylated lysosomal membrane protein A-like isoform X2 n=1 Tax=Antedon mediterranea TaxID=105859 RepID=UPI003AF68D2A